MANVVELAKDLLSAALISVDAKLTMIRLCQPADFPDGPLRQTFQEICTLGFTAEHLDIEVLADRCSQLRDVILKLAERMPNPRAAEYYAGRLAEERHRRHLQLSVAEMADLLRNTDMPLDQLGNELDRIWLRVRDGRPRPENRLLNISEVELPESFLPPHSCGFPQWEALSAGFCPELFHLLYGRAGIGKTTWMSQVTGEMAQRGASSLIVSLEVPPKYIKKTLVDQGYPEGSVWVWEHPSEDLATLKADIHYAIRARAVTAVMIDHLGLVQCAEARKHQGRLSELEEIMRQLFMFGRRLQISTLLLWHENREGKLRYRCDGFPDSITRMECEDAKVPRPEMLLNVEKARHGREGNVVMRFNRLLRRFEEEPWGSGNGQ
jgi:replicative DNA helicase